MMSNRSTLPQRNGTVVVLVAIMLPVMLIICAIAINLSYIQLTRTELKIATDAAARAGGRAYSEFQDVNKAKDFAQRAAEMNLVGGEPLVLSTNESAREIMFGESRSVNDQRYVFSHATEQEIRNGAVVSGIQVNATQTASLVFGVGTVSSVSPNVSSVASQIERDIALVIDRSGSMAYFEGQDLDAGKGEDYLYNTITALYNDPANNIPEDDYRNAVADYQPIEDLASMSLNERAYTEQIIGLLGGDLKVYAESVNSDYRSRTAGPRFSRWDMLEQASKAFFDVLDRTVQQELVSIASFSNRASVDVDLTSDMDECREAVYDMFPTGSTAIGNGMLDAFEALSNAPNRRRSAIQTLIVFSDGANNTGQNPSDAADDILLQNPTVVIHTVTFGIDADINGMRAVADKSNGSHYHANNADELINIFRILAASHRTLITQ